MTSLDGARDNAVLHLLDRCPSIEELSIVGCARVTHTVLAGLAAMAPHNLCRLTWSPPTWLLAQEASLQRVDMATMNEVIRLTRGKQPNACTARLHVEIPSTAGISPEEKDELELRHPHLRMTLVPADDLSSQIGAGAHHPEEDEPEDGNGIVHGDMYGQQQTIHYMLDEWEEDAEAVEDEEADALVEAEAVV